MDGHELGGSTMPFEHISGQSSIGNGENSMEVGINALKCTTSALVLKGKQPNSALHRRQRAATTVREWKQQRAAACGTSGMNEHLVFGVRSIL